MDDPLWSQVGVPPGYFVPAGLMQQLVNPQCMRLRDPPRVHRLTTHPVLEVPLTLYHEYPRTMFGHCLGEGRAAQAATNRDDVIGFAPHAVPSFCWSVIPQPFE